MAPLIPPNLSIDFYFLALCLFLGFVLIIELDVQTSVPILLLVCQLFRLFQIQICSLKWF